MDYPDLAGDARTRAAQLVASAEDPAHPVSAEARAVLVDALTEDIAAAESTEARLARLEAQLDRIEQVLLVLIDRAPMP